MNSTTRWRCSSRARSMPSLASSAAVRAAWTATAGSALTVHTRAQKSREGAARSPIGGDHAHTCTLDAPYDLAALALAEATDRLGGRNPALGEDPVGPDLAHVRHGQQQL